MLYGHVPGIDKPVSRLVQGTASLYNFAAANATEDAYRILDLALAYGYNTFDSAENYSAGVEKLLGGWINARGVREQVVTMHKGAHPYDGRHRVTPEDIATDLTGSLRTTGLDYFDLYVLHRDDPSYPVGPIVEALNEHVQAGRIRAFGGSNWSHDRLREANEYAAAHGLIPFAASSPHFSLAVQTEEPWDKCISLSGAQGEAARDWYQREQFAMLPWSSLCSGFFSGKFRRDNLDDPAFGNYWDKVVIRCYCSEENFQRLDRVRELADTRGATVPQIALAYIFNQPLNVFPVVFCWNEAQFAENAGALEIKLTPDELAWLENGR